MKAAVVIFPGSNREGDVVKALRARPAPTVRDGLARRRRSCPPAPISSCCRAASPTATICAAAPSPAAPASWTRCARMRRAAGCVLGICNGFQILCEAGLLPGILMRNANLKFVCHRQTLRVERNDTAFTRRYAQGRGRSTSASPTARATTSPTPRRSRARGRGLVAFRYATPRRDHRGCQPQRLDERHRRHLFARAQRARA